MNQNINTTLAALIPVLRMNGENVVSIEAVHDWYKGQYKDANGRPREYMKEVAEITYESGGVKYADIGGDSNLTACYDVIAVIQQTKPQSAVIERIERGVYPAAQPERKRGHWIEVDDHYNRISGRCSVCGWESHMYEDDVVGMDFCPNCGARLQEGEENR